MITKVTNNEHWADAMDTSMDARIKSLFRRKWTNCSKAWPAISTDSALLLLSYPWRKVKKFICYTWSFICNKKKSRFKAAKIAIRKCKSWNYNSLHGSGKDNSLYGFRKCNSLYREDSSWSCKYNCLLGKFNSICGFLTNNKTICSSGPVVSPRARSWTRCALSCECGACLYIKQDSRI